MRLSLKIALALVAAFAAMVYVRGQVRVQQRLAAAEAGARQDQELLVSALAPTIARTFRVDGAETAAYELKYAQQHQDHRTHRRLRLVRLDAGDGPEPRVPAGRIGITAEQPLASHVIEGQGGAQILHTYGWLPIGVEDGPAYALEAARRLPDRSALFARLLREEAPAMGLFLAVAALLAFLIGGVFVGRPLSRLVEHTERVGAGDLEARVSVPQRDELGALAAAMNRMTERLARSQEQIRAEHQAKLQAVSQLRHSERLATIGKLAAGLAHELATPLNVIKGRAELIAEQEDAGESVRANVQNIGKQVDRITRIVRGLLTFSRAGDDGSPERGEVALAEVLTASLDLVQIAARHKHISLQRTGAGDASAIGDAGQLEQVVTNLIVNALDASPEGATVSVGCEGPDADDRVRLWVEDRGCGISEQAREHLFEPFFTTKGNDDGTGLGLAIVYGIVKEHGGRIEVESEAGRGSRFTVWLPAARREAPPARAAGA